ncbi:hypothetical protein B0H12DRAFT_1239481 [Mycena haematopus]|nr:hypothetical protein B0H12DRAFT_1239481 [Mycena haematopus]
MPVEARTSNTRRPGVAKPKAEPGAPRKAKKTDENRAPTPALEGARLQAFHEYLEKKYDAEGCNTADVVYARIENDAHQAAKPDASAPSGYGQGEAEGTGDALTAQDEEGSKEGATATAEEASTIALEKENTELKQKLARALANGDSGSKGATREPVPRPAGTAGMDFSIQEAMGLAGSHQDYEQYKSIQRAVRDLALNARINWELPWKQIPVQQKSTLFDVARGRHPYLAEFHNDWATEELVKQWMKNRRSRAYKKQWIPVPAGYGHLKGNAAKRNPSAPRGRQNKIAKASAAKKTAAKKKAPKKAPKKSKGQKKQAQVVGSDEDEAEDSMDVDSEGSYEE